MQLDLGQIGQTVTTPEQPYDWRTCATYALGVGAGPEALDYVWEGSPAFKIVPSFAVVPTFPIVTDVLRRVQADFRTLVHGEQAIRLLAPPAREGVLRSTGRISGIHDKGKGAVVVIETETRDGADRPLFETTWSIFCRGQGGFGGDRGPTPALPEARPGAAPALARRMATAPNQALLYRLSGDLNPLHADPAFAQKVGFRAPILHGLCTYGFAARAVVEGLCGGDPTRLRRLAARFSKEVYPGDVLDLRAVPAMNEGTFLLEVVVEDRVVLSHGIVEVG